VVGVPYALLALARKYCDEVLTLPNTFVLEVRDIFASTYELFSWNTLVFLY